jgi:hypothetical protein
MLLALVFYNEESSRSVVVIETLFQDEENVIVIKSNNTLTHFTSAINYGYTLDSYNTKPKVANFMTRNFLGWCLLTIINCISIEVKII